MSVLDVRGIAALLKGKMTFKVWLEAQNRAEVVVPREVIRHFQCAIAALPDSDFRGEMTRRLDRISREIFVAEETDEFNKAFVRLRVARPDDDVLDTVVAAHSLALGVPVLTAGKGPFAAIAGVEVKDWG